MKRIGRMLRQATRRQDEPLNILTFPTHERYETGLCMTGHRFWALRAPGIKDWNTNYAPLPPNYILLNPLREDEQIPAELDFDLVLSQNKFGQFQRAEIFSRQLHVPMISLEHTLPPIQWVESGKVEKMRQMKGHFNVFISDYSRGKWGWSPSDASVIHHGVDTDFFSPNRVLVPQKQRQVLSVVNDWINRDWCCGYELWKSATAGLPVHPVGDTPGLSKPASGGALVKKYRESAVFVNTSLVSPIPTALLEAMACGCAVVSTDNCMIPEVIEHGVNGFLANDPKELRKHCQVLLDDKELAGKVGEAARKTIVEKFAMDKFVKNWNRMFAVVADYIYVGPPE